MMVPDPACLIRLMLEASKELPKRAPRDELDRRALHRWRELERRAMDLLA